MINHITSVEYHPQVTMNEEKDCVVLLDSNISIDKTTSKKYVWSMLLMVILIILVILFIGGAVIYKIMQNGTGTENIILPNEFNISVS